ncbi:hypothetical protein O6H91_Y219000 [Diphasiastrum complanatum]|nr:hypothetical protein O6H91_Y219000 [Diphasiastrum complanatum]
MLVDQRPTAPSFAENFRFLLPLFATFHQPLLAPYQPIFLIQFFFFAVYYLSWTPTLHHSWRPTSASISAHPPTLLSVFTTLPRTIHTPRCLESHSHPTSSRIGIAPRLYRKLFFTLEGRSLIFQPCFLAAHTSFLLSLPFLGCSLSSPIVHYCFPYFYPPFTPRCRALSIFFGGCPVPRHIAAIFQLTSGCGYEVFLT